MSTLLSSVFFPSFENQIYSLPDFKCLYEARNFVDLPQILVDSKGLPVVDKPVVEKPAVENESAEDKPDGEYVS